MSSTPTCAVVICAYTQDRWEDTLHAVASVRAQDRPPEEFVVVIDHNPELQARLAEQLPDVRIVANHNERGLSGARNTGVELTSSDVIAFLDDDAAAEPGWLAALARHYADPDVLGTGSRIDPGWAGERPSWWPSEFNWVVGCTYTGQNAGAVRNLLGASSSYRRELFADGGFVTGIGRSATVQLPVGCEETEFCIRASRTRPNGYFLYDDSAAVVHSVPAARQTFSYFRVRCYSEGLSKAQVTKLVGAGTGLASERKYSTVTLPLGVLRGLGRAIRGQLAGLTTAAAIVIGLAYTTVGYVRGTLTLKWGELRGGPPPGAKDSGPLRVAMVSARALPFMGGIETHVHEVCKRLAASGVQVTLLTTDTSGELPKEEVTDGYRVKRWRAYPGSRDYYLSPGLIKHLVRARHTYDVVHIQGVHTLVPPTVLAALSRRIPSVLTFHTGGHSSGFRESARALQWKLLAPLLRKTSALVAVCEFEQEKFGPILKVPAAKIRLIRNGSEPLPVDRDAPRVPGDPLVVSVGRLEEYKGHHRILRAMPAILEKAPDARLVLIGSGPFEQSLRDMAAELGIADKVSIRSFGPGERGGLGKIVSDADVVCLLSDYEAHPVAVMEAIGSGTKALLADTSGLTELGKAGLATVIPLEASPPEVATAVLAVVAAPPMAPQPIPDWDDCAKQLQELYRDVL